MTDNRTNELTLEQVEAAFEEGMDAIDWGMVRNGEGDPQEAAGIAVRAALVAAQGAAPQAEQCCQHPKCPGGSICCCAPALPSSGVDEDKLAEVRREAAEKAWWEACLRIADGESNLDIADTYQKQNPYLEEIRNE